MKYDFLIIGAGIVGLSIAKELIRKNASYNIILIEKEASSTQHGSGRNSGIIHAGFYYAKNSLKAKLTRDGNTELTQYCLDNNLKINRCGKLVVSQNETEIDNIYELAKRAKTNRVKVDIVDEQEAQEIEPSAKTNQVALYSPTTASADPVEVTQHIAKDLLNQHISIEYNVAYKSRISGNAIMCSDNQIYEANIIINAAGLYADKIAKDFGFSEKYVILPFKGLYLKYTRNDQPIKTNIYPVPNLENPFLGVHFTLTVQNEIKLGPTAIPAFWRENYQGFQNFKFDELMQILGLETKLFIKNNFNFRKLALEEIKKYNRQHLISLAENMVKNIEFDEFNKWAKPGIRAQLLNKETMELVQDFIIESDSNSVHVLNAVSPAWTSCFPFARFIVQNHIFKNTTTHE